MASYPPTLSFAHTGFQNIAVYTPASGPFILAVSCAHKTFSSYLHGLLPCLIQFLFKCHSIKRTLLDSSAMSLKYSHKSLIFFPSRNRTRFLSPWVLGLLVTASYRTECGGSNSVWFLRQGHKKHGDYPSLIMRKYLSDEPKVRDILQNCQGYEKEKKKRQRNCHWSKNTKERWLTKRNMISWFGSWNRKRTFRKKLVKSE